MTYLVYPDKQYTEWFWQRNPATTLTTVATRGTTLTPTANGTASTVVDQTGTYINYASSTVLNAIAGWTSTTFTHTQSQFDPNITFVIKTGTGTGDIDSNVAFVIGVASASPFATATYHGALFFVSSGSWFGYTQNNTSATSTTTSALLGIATDTRYILNIEFDGSGTGVSFSINGSPVARVVSNLPSTTTGMNAFCGLINHTAGTARNIRVDRVHCLQK